VKRRGADTIAAALVVVLLVVTVAACGTHDPFSGTWKSTSTGAVPKIAKSGSGWTITDSMVQSGKGSEQGSELVSRGMALKCHGDRLEIYVDGNWVMEMARQ
jgi:hypothetical protein